MTDLLFRLVFRTCGSLFRILNVLWRKESDQIEASQSGHSAWTETFIGIQTLRSIFFCFLSSPSDEAAIEFIDSVEDEFEDI